MDSVGVKASFFLIGVNVEAYPTLLQDEVNAAHDTFYHTYTHPSLITLTPEQVYVEFYKSRIAFANAVCRDPTLYRPPFGDTNAAVSELTAKMGLRGVKWNLDSND